MRPQLIAVFLLIGLLWGSEWLVSRPIGAPPLAALALRFAIAALALAGILAARQTRPPKLRTWTISAVLGITFIALPAMLTAWASGRLSPGLLVVLLAMTPLIAALLEGRATGTLLAPLIGGIAGTTLLAWRGLSFAPGQWLGAAAALAATALIAGSVVYVKHQLADAPVLPLAAVQLGSAAIVLGMASLANEGRATLVWSWKLVAQEALLGILASALAMPLYYWLLRRLESFALTSLQWVVTLTGVAEGLVLVRETPSLKMLAGAGILVASMARLLRFRPDDELSSSIKL